MLDKSKNDPIVGENVHKLLLDKGVETPMKTVFPIDKVMNISEKMKEILNILGLDLEDDSLKETPKRVAKMYVNEIFWGLDYGNFPKITTIENKMQYSSMLLERNISVKSFCEHHFLGITGVAHVAYIPNNKVVGLSKLNRVVEFFCRRPQVQERLVEQIFHTLCYILDTENVAVYISAEHSCVKLRGVEDTNCDTITSRLGGKFFSDEKLRNEFYQNIK